MTNKKIEYKLLRVIFYILFLLNQTISAYSLDTEMYVNLETYNVESNCKYGSKVYTFTITNKDNIFKQYNNVSRNTIMLSTKLDTIHPSSAYAKNKSIIKFNVYESDFKKIFKHDRLTVNYGYEIFDQDMISSKFYNAHPSSTFVISPQMYIKGYTNLSINKENLKYHIDECKQTYNTYSKKQKARALKRKKAKDKELKKKKEEARLKADKVDLIWLH